MCTEREAQNERRHTHTDTHTYTHTHTLRVKMQTYRTDLWTHQGKNKVEQNEKVA